MNRFHTLRSPALVAFSSLLISTLAAADTKNAAPRTFPLKAGGMLSIENIDGDVTIEGWKRNEVSVNAVKRGKAESLDRIKIYVESTEDQIHISTEYLDPREDDLDSELDYLESKLEGLSGRFDGGSIDYTIKAPASAVLDGIELINGTLTISGMTGRVTLSTVNGTVDATDLVGSAEIETVNGELNASFEKMDAGQSIDLSTVNGAVVLRIPAKANAEIEAETINGKISNEFDLRVDKGPWIGSSMEGQLGSGGAEIVIETVNGSIDIKKR